MSPATADRILRPYRKQERHGISTTRSGTLLKKQIPIRTFQDWNEAKPGFMEADLVAHCGTQADGSYLYTLTLTDIATGWTECLPLLNRGQEAVVAALKRAQHLLPFPILGIDTDNGGEFINVELMAFCEQEQISFTRGRPRRSNDQCYVEQKNGQVVRQVVGYDRFTGELAYRQLTELYRALRVYVNCFQPSMKLQTKQREESRGTPYLRSSANPDATAACLRYSVFKKAARVTSDYRGAGSAPLAAAARTLTESAVAARCHVPTSKLCSCFAAPVFGETVYGGKGSC